MKNQKLSTLCGLTSRFRRQYDENDKKHWIQKNKVHLSIKTNVRHQKDK